MFIMKYLGNNNLKRIALSLLAVGIMSFGVLGIITMNHEMDGMGMAGNCSDFYDATACINYHLDIMQTLSAASQSSLGLRSISLFLFFFIALWAVALFKILEYCHTRHRILLRQLYEKIVTIFALQLGHWLTLFEKRDLSCAFAIV